MTKEQTFLLSLLATAVDPAREKPDPADLSADGWDKLIGESLFQAVGYLTFTLCESFQDRIPSELYQKWNRAVIKTLGRNRNIATAQNELIALLGDHPYLILKGLASATYYPNPALRDFGDVDFLVAEDLQEEVAQILLAAGYQKANEGNDHHLVFKKPFYHLELHREPPGIPDGEIGKKIRSFLSSWQESTVLQTLDSDYLHVAFRAPSPVQHGLILLLHMQHHMVNEGLGLRHLLDWGFFVAKTKDQPFWQEELLPLLEQVGLLTYAAAMTKTCALYLGVPEPAFCRDVPEDLCAAVMEDVFLLGNFGVKDRGRSHSGGMIATPDGKSPRKKGLLWLFHKTVMEKHPVLRRVPILYPVFAIWELFAYGIGLLLGKRTRPSKLLRDAKERRTLYDRFAIFQVGNTRSDVPADSIS